VAIPVCVAVALVAFEVPMAVLFKALHASDNLLHFYILGVQEQYGCQIGGGGAGCVLPNSPAYEEFGVTTDQISNYQGGNTQNLGGWEYLPVSRYQQVPLYGISGFTNPTVLRKSPWPF